MSSPSRRSRIASSGAHLSLLGALAASTLTLSIAAHAESLATSASSAGSSASSAGSASLRGSSDSIRGSSDSSSGEAKVAEGNYRVASIDEVDGAPRMLRVTLSPIEFAESAAAGPKPTDFSLDVPELALATQPLGRGDIVSANHRPYGLEFSHAGTRKPFFLVLTHAWTQDLQTRIVTD